MKGILAAKAARRRRMLEQMNAAARRKANRITNYFPTDPGQAVAKAEVA